MAGGCLGSRLFVCVGAERGGVGGREQEIRGRPVRDGGPQEPQSARKTGDVAPLLCGKKTRDAHLRLISLHIYIPELCINGGTIQGEHSV